MENTPGLKQLLWSYPRCHQQPSMKYAARFLRFTNAHSSSGLTRRLLALASPKVSGQHRVYKIMESLGKFDPPAFFSQAQTSLLTRPGDETKLIFIMKS